MPVATKRTFSLSAEEADYIDMLVASGTFASESDVVCAGLRALQEGDTAFDRWLLEQVPPTFDKMVTDPDRGISIDDVRARLSYRHAERLRDRAACESDV